MITSLPSERESNCGNIWDIFSPVQKVGIFQTPPLRTAAGYDILRTVSTNGEVAQLVEHHVRNVGVESSNLFFSTNSQEAQKRLSSNLGRAAFFIPLR